jgi:hypothetical protein
MHSGPSKRKIQVSEKKMNFRKALEVKEFSDRGIGIFLVPISILIYGDSRARL